MNIHTKYKEDKGWKEGSLFLSILPSQGQALAKVF